MKSAQIVNQVFKKNRTLSSAYPKQKKAVLFAFVFFVLLPVGASAISGEFGKYLPGMKKAFYFPDSSNYTVVFETTYGELNMNLDSAISCMLPAVIPADYEPEAIKAMAVLLRTQLLNVCEKQQVEAGFRKIYIEKKPYKKIYFTYPEQKLLYGEAYSDIRAIYRHAALETAGMYLQEEGKLANAGWFLVSNGATREGVSCEGDYKSENYYTEKVITRKEFQSILTKIYEEENQASEAEMQVEEICFMGIGETVNFSVFLKNGSSTILTVSPEWFCEKFRLPSPFLEEVKENGSDVTITVKGLGHGSGMSVFYANELAKKGNDFTEILNYFFTNFAIDKFE